MRLLGRVPSPDLPGLYACADVFALCCRSRWGGLEQEGFGIVFLEAAAAGIPSVAGDSGGSAEAVIDGETGFVVRDPSDATAWPPPSAASCRIPPWPAASVKRPGTGPRPSSATTSWPSASAGGAIGAGWRSRPGSSAGMTVPSDCRRRTVALRSRSDILVAAA